MRALGILTLSTTLLAGCSFTTAGGLSECETSADCDENQVCTQHFCLPLPAGCGQHYGDTSADAVQLGAVLPLSNSATNPDAGKDESEVQGLNAILLALDELNQRGAAGKKLSLHVCDTAFDSTRTATQTQWLVTERKIVALLTAGSTQTLAAADVTLRNNVLTMSSSATSPELSAVSDKNGGTVGLLWRTAPSDVIQAKVVANLLLHDARFNTATKVGLIYLDDPYGQGLFDGITQQLKSGGKAFEAFSYRRKDEPSITLAVSQLDAKDPDLTVVVGFEDDASLIIKRAANSTNLKLGTGHQWFFTDSAKDQALLDDTNATVRDQVQNAYGTAPATNGGQAFTSFQSRFQAKYNGKDPSNFGFTSHSYDSMYLFGLAVAYSQGTSGSVTGPKMAEGLTKLSSGTQFQLTSSNFTEAATALANNQSINVEGASGGLQFDDAGDAPSPIELWQVSADTFKHVDNIPPP